MLIAAIILLGVVGYLLSGMISGLILYRFEEYHTLNADEVFVACMFGPLGWFVSFSFLFFVVLPKVITKK